jgi:hypothetical protein
VTSALRERLQDHQIHRTRQEPSASLSHVSSLKVSRGVRW